MSRLDGLVSITTDSHIRHVKTQLVGTGSRLKESIIFRLQVFHCVLFSHESVLCHILYIYSASLKFLSLSTVMQWTMYNTFFPIMLSHCTYVVVVLASFISLSVLFHVVFNGRYRFGPAYRMIAAFITAAVAVTVWVKKVVCKYYHFYAVISTQSYNVQALLL